MKMIKDAIKLYFEPVTTLWGSMKLYFEYGMIGAGVGIAVLLMYHLARYLLLKDMP